MKWVRQSATVLVPIVFAALAAFIDPYNVGALIVVIAIFGVAIATWVYVRRHPQIAEVLSGLWRQRIWLIFLLTAVATGGICGLYVEHKGRLQEKERPIEDAMPWERGLVARVYFSKPVSKEMREGFAYTMGLLGYSYVEVDTSSEANLRIWIDSWEGHCKWPPTEGFAVLDLEPSEGGSDIGDIHICRIRAPLKWNRLSDYALMAHETAHVIAAQEHIGDGLMGEGGGDGSESFNETEVQAMCAKVNSLPQPIRSKGWSGEGRIETTDRLEGPVSSAC